VGRVCIIYREELPQQPLLHTGWLSGTSWTTHPHQLTTFEGWRKLISWPGRHDLSIQISMTSILSLGGVTPRPSNTYIELNMMTSQIPLSVNCSCFNRSRSRLTQRSFICSAVVSLELLALALLSRCCTRRLSCRHLGSNHGSDSYRRQVTVLTGINESSSGLSSLSYSEAWSSAQQSGWQSLELRKASSNFSTSNWCHGQRLTVTAGWSGWDTGCYFNVKDSDSARGLAQIRWMMDFQTLCQVKLKVVLETEEQQ